MKRWRGIESTPAGWGRSVVTIGVFDGVHRGHQQIIGRAVAAAREADLPSVVVSFDPHPSEVVRPGSHPAILTDLDRRGDLVAELGVDGFCVLPFTREFSQLPPETFVHDLLVERLHAARVVVGENFRFGHRAAGDTALLSELGTRFGFTTDAVSLAGAGSTVYSSTYVRSCVDAGDVESAAEALGRPHRVSGLVVRGANRGGTQLGFPTANLHHDPHAAVPADAIYAGWLWRPMDQVRLPAAISVGTNPTFSGSGRTVEAHVLDFDGDLYGEPISLDFVTRLREQRAYDALPPLIAQIEADVADTRKALGV
ncbi:MAG TPA: bifunctional riboflavin kinase/FAD synthetase [Stackebrandtia sp.]|uniref:bifunctional riboflavin kinase/FAD synthetase n=1 Tax=Stackebrandtia sp. TaxID=2023065 RepID=UPI002D2A41DF|nr:bifunctional riboflavin kinase/FAD synthetase [Stackebrandtia sp.]HZE40698.1 bifunctional riboflavin kinase/FAD synthetase [Stackebrandtia sp.]